MALKSEVMAKGVPSAVADTIGFDVAAAGLSGAGTSSQSAATPLVSSFSLFTTVASNSGALLPQARSKSPYVVYNGGSNPLLVYPATGESINGGSANASFSVTNGKSCTFFAAGNQWIANLSS